MSFIYDPGQLRVIKVALAFGIVLLLLQGADHEMQFLITITQLYASHLPHWPFELPLLFRAVSK